VQQTDSYLLNPGQASPISTPSRRSRAITSTSSSTLPHPESEQRTSAANVTHANTHILRCLSSRWHHPLELAAFPNNRRSNLDVIVVSLHWGMCFKICLQIACGNTCATAACRSLSPTRSVRLFLSGPNYAWQPSGAFRRFAHFLIDECGVDLIHGHSSHHVQVSIFDLPSFRYTPLERCNP